MEVVPLVTPLVRSRQERVLPADQLRDLPAKADRAVGKAALRRRAPDFLSGPPLRGLEQILAAIGSVDVIADLLAASAQIRDRCRQLSRQADRFSNYAEPHFIEAAAILCFVSDTQKYFSKLFRTFAQRPVRIWFA
jgi:hypothetical protein